MVMLITTILLTLVMIIIWRTSATLVFLFFVTFFTMESIYISAVLTKLLQGGWIPFLISFILAFIMFGWYYGRQRKIDYELTHKIHIDGLRALLSSPGVQRVPGICFFYTNTQDGFTPVLGHYIKNTKSLHKVAIFTTFSYLSIPNVASHERILVTKLGLLGIYGCTIQYGFRDSLNLEGGDLVDQVYGCLEGYIRESLGHQVASEAHGFQEELANFEEAKNIGRVHIRGKTRFYIGRNSSLFDRSMLAFYEVMHSKCRSSLPALGVSLPHRIEVGMLYEA